MQLPVKYRTRVLRQRQLSSTAYELTLERGGFEFTAGRLIMLHGAHPTEDRSYTVCSGEQDDVVQVLYRYIPTGRLTPKLLTLVGGDQVDWSGPYGEFVLRDPTRPMVFVATGTGIAPCRSYIRSHPALDVTLVHGVRTEEDLFYKGEFEGLAYHAYISRGTEQGRHGRVVDYFTDQAACTDLHYYLCGANEMIFDVHALLRERGVEDAQIFTEAYYYRASD